MPRSATWWFRGGKTMTAAGASSEARFVACVAEGRWAVTSPPPSKSAKSRNLRPCCGGHGIHRNPTVGIRQVKRLDTPAVSGKGSKVRTHRIQAMGHFFIRRLTPNIIKYPGLEYPKGIPMSAHFYDFKTETDVHWEGMSLLSVISQVGSIFTTTRKIKHKIEPNIINYPMI